MPLRLLKDCPPGPTDAYFRAYVPKDPGDNIKWRMWLLKKVLENDGYADELWMICARDILFYINCFGWLQEPREKAPWSPSRWFGEAKELPFLTRDYQDDYIRLVLKHLGRQDIVTDKSREMGATWMALYVIDHEWRFKTQVHSGLLSKDEDTVLSDKDPDSLFAKLNFIDAHLPDWLRPKREVNTSEGVITNLETQSTISGYAATGTAMRGGRKKFIFQDEMHFFPIHNEYSIQETIQHATHCRWIVSTINRTRGQTGAFYDICADALSAKVKITIDWKDDKEKAAGLYTSEQGELKILDKDYKFPDDYPFVLDGKTRSPYYDWECRRPLATSSSIAAELDRDFGGSTAKFFDPEVITWGFRQVCDPIWRANIVPDDGNFLPWFDAHEQGEFLFWRNCPKNEERGLYGPLKEGKFSVGADVAAGTGGMWSSCSAIEVIDMDTGEEVMQYRSIRIMPDVFARLVYAVGQYFNWAIVAPEITGSVGGQFLDQFRELRYPRPYLRGKSRDSVVKGESLKIGIDNKDRGETVLGELQQAMRAKLFKPRSRILVEECERYFRGEDGKLTHPMVGRGTNRQVDHSHGDCAIAAASAWFAARENRVEKSEVESPAEIPFDCWLAGRRQYEAAHSTKRSWWDPLQPAALPAYGD